MSTEQMRVAISKAYPGERWAEKVKNMPSQQVRATYMRLMNAKQLSLKEKK